MSKIIDDRPTFSQASIDGVYRLFAGIVKNAVKDLKSEDPTESLDALDFLMTDGYMYLVELLGYDLNPDEIFTRMVNNG